MPPLPEDEGNSPFEELQRANQAGDPETAAHPEAEESRELPGGASPAAQASQRSADSPKTPDLKGNSQEREMLSNRVGAAMGMLAGRAKQTLGSKKALM